MIPDADTSVTRMLGDVVGIDRDSVLPRVPTYRNAYGTHFVCTSTCSFVLLTYAVTVTLVLAILFLIPVAPRSRKERTASASSVPQRAEGVPGGSSDHDTSRCALSVPRRLAALWRRIWSEDLTSLKTRDDNDDAAAATRLLEDEQQLKLAQQQVKTYESIAVDTEDLAPVADPPPAVSPGPRASIFARTAAPSKRRAARSRDLGRSVTGADQLGSTTSIGASETSFFSDLSLVSRGDTARGLPELLGSTDASTGAGARGGRRMSTMALGSSGGSGDKSDEMVRAIERRASIQHRAEKRKEQAKSDLSYENLRDEEIQMYEYLEFVRELLEGMVVKKLCQRSAKVVKRTFFITKDMTTVYWNQLGAKNWIQKKSSLDVSRIDKVLKGYHGNANVEAKGKAEKSALYVSVVCSDGKRLDLEAKDEVTCLRLFVGFSRLAAEKRHEQKQQHADDAAAMPSVDESADVIASPAQQSSSVPAADDLEEKREAPQANLSMPQQRAAETEISIPTAATRNPETHDGLEVETETVDAQLQSWSNEEKRISGIDEDDDEDNEGDR